MRIAVALGLKIRIALRKKIKLVREIRIKGLKKEIELSLLRTSITLFEKRTGMGTKNLIRDQRDIVRFQVQTKVVVRLGVVLMKVLLQILGRWKTNFFDSQEAKSENDKILRGITFKCLWKID